MAPGDILCDEGSQQIAWHLPALRIYHPDPVTVTIKANAELCRFFADFTAQNFQCLRIDRIRVMIRECAINFREQNVMLAANLLHKLCGDVASGSIAAIPDDGHAIALHASGYARDIALFHRGLVVAAAGGVADAHCTGSAKQCDIVTKERATPHHHLEAVMLWRRHSITASRW